MPTAITEATMQKNSRHPSRRRFTQGACALGLLPWLASCGGSGDGVSYGQSTGPASSSYGRAIGDMLASYHLPGVLAGVRIAGQPAWMQAFGKADLATGAPLALNSTFPIRSITKSFTVTLVLQLVRDGVLSLDDKIGRYFGGVPNGKLISLADMAGNQSGLVSYSSLKPFIDIFVADLQHVWTEQELVQFSFAVPPDFKPGAQYDYSNTNTVLLGMLVELVTGQTLADAMATRIFKPLALTGTAYPSTAALPPPAPTPYAVDIDTGASDEQPLISPTSLAGSGAISSTLANLLDWGDELGRGSLVGSALNDLRRSTSRPATNGPEYDRYGLGIGQIGNWWGHTGSGVGFQVATMHLASRGATVSVMVNATPEGSPRRDLNFAQELFQRLAAVVEAG